MHELSLLCPQESIEILSDALEALDALSVSVEDADAQTDAEQALFGEPGMPPPKEAGNARACWRLFPDRSCCDRGARAAAGAGLLCWLPDCWASDGARAGLGAPDAVAIRAGRNHARILDRPDLA